LQKRKDKKKNMMFLFVSDKGSYTGSFLVVFLCMYVFTTNPSIFSNYLHSTLVPFLWWFQPV
jgi:hypothetical protein